jgi:hypothetical protein
MSCRVLKPPLGKHSKIYNTGDSIFVHGGLERINEEVRDWINGSAQGHCKLYGQECSGVVKENFVRGGEELRLFSSRTRAPVLATIPGAKRMIMGHTIHFQEVGINAEVSHFETSAASFRCSSSMVAVCCSSCPTAEANVVIYV